MSHSETQLLAALLGRKFECLARLDELGQQQLAAIDEDRITDLLSLLAAKQESIQRLQEIERHLDPFRGQDPERRQWASEGERLRCGELLTRCERMYQEVMQREKQSEHRLRLRRDEAAERLQGANTAGFARHAYASEPHGRHGSLDLSTEG